MASVVALAALVVAGVLEYFSADSREFYVRVVGTVAILDVLGTVALVPLSRLAVASLGSSKKSSKKPRPASRRRRSLSAARRR